MSYFSFTVTTPANTPEARKQQTKLTLSSGVIHQVRIRIPPGHANLAHLQIKHHLHQIVPSNADGDVHGDDDVIEYQEFYELHGTDTVLVAETWNEDETYEHSFLLGFGVLPSWVLLPFRVVNKITGAFKSLIGAEE